MAAKRAEGARCAGAGGTTEATASARDRLLAAALQVLGDHGYKGATSRKIARAAGVNEVTIFRLFKTKDDLLTEALVVRAEADRPLQRVASGDLVADLLYTAEAVIKSQQENGHLLARLFPQVEELPAPHAARVRQAIRRTIDISRELFRHYQATGALRAECGDQIWTTFMGPILMTIRHAEVEGRALQFDVREHVRLFLHGCAGPGTAPEPAGQ